MPPLIPWPDTLSLGESARFGPYMTACKYCFPARLAPLDFGAPPKPSERRSGRERQPLSPNGRGSLKGIAKAEVEPIQTVFGLGVQHPGPVEADGAHR